MLAGGDIGSDVYDHEADAGRSGADPDEDPLVASVLNTPCDPHSNKPRSDFERSADYANYFITYGLLCHQKQMLEDQHRMDTYHRAITNNPDCFKDKVVLDLGTGTGVLAVWAARAGARKVYAVEATPMARFAEKLVKANGFESVITVIQGKIEDLPVPEEKADVMVSEWMGYLLLRESMLDSVVYARDNWMKPGGAMYPSHATIYLAPVHTGEVQSAVKKLTREVSDWRDFLERTRRMFGFDMSAVQEDFMTEQRVYFLQSVAWLDLPASCIVGNESPILSMDLHTVTVEQYRSFKSEFDCLVHGNSTATAIAGWFEVEFRGSRDSPTQHTVRLTTAPSPNGRGTHWGQQVFYLHPSAQFKVGDRLKGTIQMQRNAYNHRLLDFDVSLYVHRQDGKDDSHQTLRYVLE